MIKTQFLPNYVFETSFNSYQFKTMYSEAELIEYVCYLFLDFIYNWFLIFWDYFCLLLLDCFVWTYFTIRDCFVRTRFPSNVFVWLVLFLIPLKRRFRRFD